MIKKIATVLIILPILACLINGCHALAVSCQKQHEEKRLEMVQKIQGKEVLIIEADGRWLWGELEDDRIEVWHNKKKAFIGEYWTVKVDHQNDYVLDKLVRKKDE